MEAKHTPGPWGRNIKPGSRYPVIFSGRNTHVAVACTNGLSDEEIEANIDLIAASPDLLELAQAYEAWEADLIMNGDWSGEFVRMNKEQHDRLLELQTVRNSIIAKATGH
jgi:hypothetical protein